MTTESQQESFVESDDRRRVHQDEVAAFMKTNYPYGFNVDEAYIALYDEAPVDYQRVAALRNAMKDCRVAGLVRDTGVKRSNYAGTAQQNVWVAGDDRAEVRAHRVVKLYKLADELGATIVWPS